MQEGHDTSQAWQCCVKQESGISPTQGLARGQGASSQRPAGGASNLAVEVAVPQIIHCAASAPQQHCSCAEEAQKVGIWKTPSGSCKGDGPEAWPCQQPGSCAGRVASCGRSLQWKLGSICRTVAAGTYWLVEPDQLCIWQERGGTKLVQQPLRRWWSARGILLFTQRLHSIAASGL